MKELDAWLAENPMEWKYSSTWDAYMFDLDYRIIDGPIDDAIIMRVKNWHPTTNIAQAIECLEKFDFWEIYKDNNGQKKYVCRVWDKNGKYHWSEKQDTPALAACLVCRKAWEANNPHPADS